MTNAPAFTAWLDEFFASYYQHRPVNATFIGVHAHDERLPDYSEHGVGDALAAAEALLARLGALPKERLSEAEAIDRKLAEGALDIQRWELRARQFQGGNPCVYTSEAAFGLISLLRRPFAPVEQRLQAAAARLEAIPDLLKQGQANVRHAPPAWIEKAIDECEGLLKLLQGGFDLFLRAHGVDRRQFAGPLQRAATAVAQFQHYTETELRQHPVEGYACGEDAFALLLRKGHFLAIDAADIEDYAWEQFSASAATLATHARDFGARTPDQALAQLAGIHPTAEGYYARYAELWDACHKHAEEHQLLTWPNYRVRYLPRPQWVRAAAPHLYFLFYHSPAPFDALPQVEYLVTPIEPDMPADQQQALLRANNDSVIKLNHVVHHGAIGHHVQNWHAFRAESRIGQIAAVDCASRIALFCGGTIAEGWACYATDLMDEFGFLTALEHYAQAQTRLRMAARALIDVRLHHGTITLEQAASFYQERVGMALNAARAEATKNSMFPGTALMYLLGTDAIHHLRHDMAERPGFELRTFHDRLLSYGSIPIALIAESMRAGHIR
jgi:Bacterial protein of unknown function (DUF885)